MSEVNPVSSADATTYPLYPSAIILPALAFPAIFLDIPPLLWHIKQRNIAAWSMIAWVIISNIFLSVNPLIWPRDNVYEWWDGAVFCDIQARITVGGMVGLPCAVTCIIRKLANIMDTRHITMAPRPARKSKENFLEVLWCWGFPAFIIVVYYIVQPIRYFIVGISGCVAAFDASWPSIIVVWVWQPIIMLFAGYYSCLLLWRLYHYRREFGRMISARDTTKSRFVRLVIMSLILAVFMLPYAMWIFYKEVKSIKGPFVWETVHGPNWNSIIKVPSHGIVWWDNWGRLVVGYLVFFIFGTGNDAKTLYKGWLVKMGLGKVFPSLYERPGDSQTSSHGSGTWNTFKGKTKSFFTAASWTSSHRSPPTTVTESSRDDAIHPVSSTAPILATAAPWSSNSGTGVPGQGTNRSIIRTGYAFLQRLFHLRRRESPQPILPVSAAKNSTEGSEPSPTYSGGSSRVRTHAWASDSPREKENTGFDGVRIVKELRQDRDIIAEKKVEDNMA